MKTKARMAVAENVRRLRECGCLAPNTVVMLCGICGPVALVNAREKTDARRPGRVGFDCKQCATQRALEHRNAHPETRIRERERRASKRGMTYTRRGSSQEIAAKALIRADAIKVKRMRAFRAPNHFNNCESWPIAGKMDMRRTYRWQLIVNPDKLRAKMRLSRWRRKNRMASKPGDASDTQIASLLLSARQCCYCGLWFGRNDKTIEHFIPLSRGGTNTLINLGVACRSCNNAKNNKLPSEFEIAPHPMLRL